MGFFWNELIVFLQVYGFFDCRLKLCVFVCFGFRDRFFFLLSFSLLCCLDWDKSWTLPAGPFFLDFHGH